VAHPRNWKISQNHCTLVCSHKAGSRDPAPMLHELSSYRRPTHYLPVYMSSLYYVCTHWDWTMVPFFSLLWRHRLHGTDPLLKFLRNTKPVLIIREYFVRNTKHVLIILFNQLHKYGLWRHSMEEKGTMVQSLRLGT
jgi:hypothetical protein